MTDARFSSCRGCRRTFTSGWGAQSIAPRLCEDCLARELAYHGHHAPGVVCVMEYAQ